MAKRGPQRDYDADFKSVLASVDRQGRRQWLYVDLVWGAWRRRRVLLALLLIGFYLAVPFLSIGGEPFLRLDIPGRRFVILGQTFWPQDLIYLLLFVLLAVVGTVATVSLFGRVFCGWLCPHNVFLEMFFRPVEALFEGRAHRRRLADQGGGGSGRVPRKIAKHLVYLLLCGILANTATAIFVGTEAFIAGLVVDPVNHPSAALFFALFFALCWINFTWFREQTCTIVCPYGRLQSALLDQHSLTVAYDPRRGEPRGSERKKDGGCIDCYRCVAVCPTGIDIRNGNQMECIHCSACIDACDDVMARLDQPPGLIAYTSEKDLLGEQRQVWRGRTILYSVVLAVLMAVTLTAVVLRPPLQVTLLRFDTGTLVAQAADGTTVLQRLVRLALVNKTGRTQEIAFSVAGLPEARVVTTANPLDLDPNQRIVADLLLEIPLAAMPGPLCPLELTVTSGEHHRTYPVTIDQP